MKRMSGVAAEGKPRLRDLLNLVAYLRYALPEVEKINVSSAMLLSSAIAGLEDEAMEAAERQETQRPS